MPESPQLRYERRGAVALLTIDRPKRRNALSPQTIQLFATCLDRAEADSEIYVVCITGAGDKAFCSGADLMATVGAGSPMQAMQSYANLLLRLDRYSKPLVARVNGHCLGGGLGLLLSCDIAYARRGVRIGTPELNVGLFPMMITPLILRAAPRAKALEMIYTAAMLDADEAEALGLITRALDPDDFDPRVEAALTAISGKAPLALRAGRQALSTVQGMDLEPAMQHLCGQLAVLMQTQDALEGLAAFMQKRKPVWKGR